MLAESPHSAIYLLRTTHQYHAQLIVLADQKASILIGVSSVIVTLVLSKWDLAATPAAPLVLAATCALAALLAVVAVVPSFHWQRRKTSEPNPLFFGSFAEMEEAEYMWRMQDVIRTEHNVYWAMARDIYHMGRALYARKFRFLSYSYRVFAAGLAATIATAGYAWMV
jgi:hypothetical protein